MPPIVEPIRWAVTLRNPCFLFADFCAAPLLLPLLCFTIPPDRYVDADRVCEEAPRICYAPRKPFPRCARVIPELIESTAAPLAEAVRPIFAGERIVQMPLPAFAGCSLDYDPARCFRSPSSVSAVRLSSNCSQRFSSVSSASSSSVKVCRSRSAASSLPIESARRIADS